MSKRYYLKFTTKHIQKCLQAELPEDLKDLPVEIVLIPMQARNTEVNIGLVRSIVESVYAAAVLKGSDEVVVPFDVPSDADYARYGLKREGELLIPDC